MAPFWQDCVKFLCSAQLLGENVVIESLEQLAVLLSDGVILCKLAKLLKSESVEDHKILRRHSMNQRSNFLSSNNIKLFLTACRRFLSVPEEYFFNIEDLSDYQNFEKVLRLVSYLSRSNYAQNLGLQGFEEIQTNPSEYIHLSEVVEERLDEYLQLNEIAYELENRENENIEQNIVGSVHYTQVVTGTPPIGEYIEGIPANRRLRNLQLKELDDFENETLKQLKQLKTIYNQLENDVTESNREIMFYKIPELTQVHQNFYDELKPAIEMAIQPVLDTPTDSTLSIGSICQNYKVELAHTYKQRLIKLEEAISTRKMLWNVNGALKTHLNNQLLVGVLENPIQKLCFYQLILKKVHDESDDENFSCDIKLAYEAFIDICHFLNSVYFRIGIVKGFTEYLRNFPTSKDTLVNYGNLLWDDRIEVVRSMKGNRNTKKIDKCHVFLFDTHIIFCKEKTLRYEFLEQFELKGFKQSDIRESNTRWFSTLFQWTIDNSANGLSFTFIFQKKKECERVHKDFQNAIEATKPSGSELKRQKHKFKTRIYSIPSTCDGCNKLFDVLGYTCEKCHKIFDIECLKNVPCPNASFIETNLKPSDILQVIKIQEDEVYVKVLGAGNESQVLKLKADDENCDVDHLCLQETIPRRITLSQPQFPLTAPPLSEYVLNIPSQDQDINKKIWYFGELSRTTTDSWLANAPVGAFLFRFGSSKRYLLSIKKPNGISHLQLGPRYSGQTASSILGTHRFNTFEEYIEYFRRNHFDQLYDNVEINTTLTYAFIRTNFLAKFAFVATLTDGSVLQVHVDDLITVVDTSNEETGFWQVTIDGKPAQLPWSLICKFCESILVEEAPSTSCRTSYAISPIDAH